MKKINTLSSNGLTIIENYNNLLGMIRKVKTVDDMRSLVGVVKDFIATYKQVDKTLANKVYEMLQTKLSDMVVENDFVFQRANTRVEEVRNRAYDFKGEKNDSQEVQSKVLQIMAMLPKNLNTANSNRATTVLTDSINSGVVGSKAVLELLKYPAYADMVSAKVRERAFEGSKSSAQLAFDRLKESELREAEQSLASVYMQGFHLRKLEKNVTAFKKPSNWNTDETA